jgi:hypothetical protein
MFLRNVLFHVQDKINAAVARCFLAQLIFDPEEGAISSLRNVGSHTIYTAVYPTRLQHITLYYVYVFLIRLFLNKKL